MGTTIFPINNAGPFEDDGPMFPVVAGQGSFTEIRLLESRRKSPKQIIKEAEGVLNPSRSRAKKMQMARKPRNLRASAKGKKRGAFGEAYAQPRGNASKGVRVAESAAGQRLYERLVRKYVRRGHPLHEAQHRARLFLEKAPPGWEGTVKAMKKHPKITNPWALAWHMKGEGDKPHH